MTQIMIDGCRFRDFGPYLFMMKNFAASWSNLVRPWTIITSCFSHMDTSHIFVNLFSFYFMGKAAMSILSTSQFASLYLLAGLAGNAVQMLWHPVQGNTGQPAFALGASGAISGGEQHETFFLLSLCERSFGAFDHVYYR